MMETLHLKLSAPYFYPTLKSAIFQKGQLKTQLPRHNEIVDELARKICKDLDVPFVR